MAGIAKKVKKHTTPEEIFVRALFDSLKNVEQGKIDLVEFKKICCIFAKTSPEGFGNIIKQYTPYLYKYYQEEIIQKLVAIA